MHNCCLMANKSCVSRLFDKLGLQLFEQNTVSKPAAMKTRFHQKAAPLGVKKSFSINGLRLSINQASLMFCIRLAPLASQARNELIHNAQLLPHSKKILREQAFRQAWLATFRTKHCVKASGNEDTISSKSCTSRCQKASQARN